MGELRDWGYTWARRVRAQTITEARAGCGHLDKNPALEVERTAAADRAGTRASHEALRRPYMAKGKGTMDAIYRRNAQGQGSMEANLMINDRIAD